MATNVSFEQTSEEVIEVFGELASFADAYRGDPEFRARADADPKAALAGVFELPSGVASDVELRFAANTDEVHHLVLPPDPNAVLSDEALGMVAGGKSASTIGSAGSASTVSTVCTTASCAASASSLGSAGSAS